MASRKNRRGYYEYLSNYRESDKFGTRIGSPIVHCDTENDRDEKEKKADWIKGDDG
jgi:hypothetical protein